MLLTSQVHLCSLIIDLSLNYMRNSANPLMLNSLTAFERIPALLNFVSVNIL
jgi:hypothetical protein